MRKNNGFTLIELIAVIALIALLSLVIIPSIIGLVNKNKPKLDSATKELIYSATGEYLDANQTRYIKASGAVYCITFKNLIDNGFVDENLVDIKTGEKYDQNLIVKSSYNGYKYNYEILSSGATCTEKSPDISNPNITISALKYDGEENKEMYSNIEHTIDVTVTTNKIKDNESLILKIRRGSNYVEYFEITGGIVKSNKTSFKITVPNYTKAGEYVIEVSYKDYKSTKTFVIIGLIEPPNLLNNSLTPVVYDESKSAWVVADTNKLWYDYSKQEWANAVILNSGVTKNVGDTVVVPTDTSETSEVKAMLVWIPRYEYHIEGTYGTHLDGTAGTQALPGQIEIKFIPQDKTIADSNYIIHPAFTWDNNNDGTITSDEHISGIWVGKFETTGTGTEPTILPNMTSLIKQNVNAQFNTALKLKNYLNTVGTTDSHMMKNSEWGAVAYLSQSIYGKYGNELYTGYYKRVYKNDSSQFYTGRSRGIYSQDEYSASGTCSYNDISDRGNGTGSCGGGASTTGNITGVYDMSGGAYEYVMGYLTTANKSLFGANNKDQNAWSTAPASKYYDAYTNTSVSKACNEGICYGQALSETSGWSNNIHAFVDTGLPWLLRGGSYQASPQPGLFTYDQGVGNQYNYYSFRTVFLMPGA